MHEDDRLISVDNVVVRGMTAGEVAPLIRGPVGTTIVLEVYTLNPNPSTPTPRAPNIQNAETNVGGGRPLLREGGPIRYEPSAISQTKPSSSPPPKPGSHTGRFCVRARQRQ